VLEKLTHDDFSKWLKQKFQIQHDGGTLEVELIECRALTSPRRSGAEREPFALIFRGPRQPVLAQRIYKFEGGTLDPLEMFIVPVGPDAIGMRYEAIFS
jgi:hypothetical protein